VANGKSDGTGPWLRVSAWLPPGLALGWLATLATFVRGVGTLLTAWAATVSLVVGTVSLIVLLARLRPTVSPSNAPQTRTRTSGHVSPTPPDPTSPDIPPTVPTPSDVEEREADGAAHLASAKENVTTSASRKLESTSGRSDRAEYSPRDSAPRSAPDSTVSGAVGPTEQLATPDIAVMLGLRVLTAAEVASVLRVDANVIIRAISNGEFPGNRVGDHWRVDHAAVARWLLGKYGGVVDRAASQSSTEPMTDPT
jgi:excisionase family DNA binding protein